MKSYNILTHKLDVFIKKYYKNMLLRGAIIASVLLTFAFVFAILAEYFGHFSIPVRTSIFYILLGSAIFMIGRFVVFPLFKLFKLSKNISYKEAANIIVTHFSQIQDKLLNTLELFELNSTNSKPDPLLSASIEQKIEQISIFPFRKAIDYKENYKYLKYIFIVLFLIGAIFIYSPSIFSESTIRILNHATFYEKPSPFSFTLLNKNLNIKKGDDLLVEVEMSGNYIPENVYINYANNTFAMQKKSTTTFEYNFRNLNNSLNFQFNAEDFTTKNYEIKVLPAPSIIDFTLFADVPNYTGKDDVTYNNTGDLTIPVGTKLSWNFITQNIDSLTFISTDSLINNVNKKGDNFSINKNAQITFDYSISVKNKYFSGSNLVEYNITVIPDLYPAIQVREIKDSSNFFLSYFKGNIGDDYGIKKLSFNYRIINGKENSQQTNLFKSMNVQFIPALLKQEFYYVFDFSSLNVPAGKQVEYFFQVWDNDGIHGSKISKTDIFKFKVPSFEEFAKMENSANQEIQNSVQKTSELAKELHEEIAKMRENSLNGEMTDWEKSQALQSIIEKQKQLEKLIKETSEKNKAKNMMKKELSEDEKALLEKQKEIEKMLDNVMTDELKELMKQIEELKKDFNKNKLDKLSQEMDLSFEDMQKQLDRNLEMLKRFEVEQKVDNAINELKKLAEKQENLADKTEKENAKSEDLQKEQKDLKEEFKAATQEYEKAKELNDKLKTPMKLDEFQKQKEEVNSDMKDSESKISKGKNSKAAKSQKSASEKMSKMASDMQAMMDANNAEQNAESMENLRQITDNLITYSFEQEKLMRNLENIYMNDPKFLEYTKKQLDLNNDFSVIRDSLYTLAERVPQLNSTVSKEVLSIQKNKKATITALENRKKSFAQIKQQEIMTSSNNLALLLSEVLKQMQQQQSGQGQGAGSQAKPGKGKKSGKGKMPSMSEMKSMQQSLKKQLEKMLSDMKNGSKPGGKDGKNGMGGHGNKAIAKMLAQQEILQQMMKDLRSKNSLSPETQRILNEIDKMQEQNEKDFVNRNITPELLRRQKKITTRMLEAEKAEDEREQEKKRKSTKGENKTYKSPEDFFKEKKITQGFNENLYHNSLKMSHFYKNLYENYADKINK